MVLPYIDMNPPRVYICSPSWTPFHLPPHPISLGHPSAPAPNTPVSCIEPNMLSRLVITYIPRSKHLLISWLQSPSAVILEPPEIKSLTVSIVSPSICHEVTGLDVVILVFWMLRFKPTFSLPSFTFIKRFFTSSFLSAVRVVSSVYLRLFIFLLAILIPAYTSCSPAFLMMYPPYKLNKQGDNI